MKEFAKKFYKSAAWRRCREAFLASKLGLCERCKVHAATIAHHKIYLTPANIDDPNISLNWNNLEALCQDCHNREHSEGGARGMYKVSADGNIAPRVAEIQPP